MKKTLYPFFGKIKVFVKTYVFIDPIFVSRQKFKRDDARLNLRETYPLNSDSIVFDLGGYIGEWSYDIFQKYGCSVYIFEPVKKFMDKAKEKLKNNPKIRFFDFGLSDKDAEEVISNDDNASSVFLGGGNVAIKLKDVKKVIHDLKIQKIDLLKLNIEGGEFKVLPRMIECGLIPLCIDIQVQFHDFYPDAEKLRNEIRTALAKSHHLTYDYPFTWENWRKNA